MRVSSSHRAATAGVYDGAPARTRRCLPDDGRHRLTGARHWEARSPKRAVEPRFITIGKFTTVDIGSTERSRSADDESLRREQIDTRRVGMRRRAAYGSTRGTTVRRRGSRRRRPPAVGRSAGNERRVRPGWTDQTRSRCRDLRAAERRRGGACCGDGPATVLADCGWSRGGARHDRSCRVQLVFADVDVDVDIDAASELDLDFLAAGWVVHGAATARHRGVRARIGRQR